MRTALVDPLSDPSWQRLVDACPEATIFHHPGWLGLLRHQYGYPVAAACAIDAGGEAVAGVPLVLVASRLRGRRLVSVPFADRCGPLVAPQAPEGALAAAAALVDVERARRGGVLEVHGSLPEAGTTVDLYHRHVVDLRDGLDAATKRFRKSVRKNIRTAERAGVEVERRTDREGLDAFFALHLATRHRLGVPTQPRSFVRGIEPLLAAGLGFVGVARLEDRPVAAAVFLGVNGTLMIKWSGSDAAALPKRPVNALFHAGMRWAIEEGRTEIDFGRTDVGQEELRRFKLGWGSREEILPYTYAGTEPGGDDGRTLRALGEIIRRTPPVTGRAIGELLYRYAG